MLDIFARSERPERYYLIFLLTHRCNLNCSYCYEYNRKGTDAREEFIKETISKYLDSPLTCDYEITFFGGEPLLRTDIIKNVCEWAWSKKWKNNYIFYANTNGTEFTEVTKKWFSLNHKKIWLGLSLDGTKITHDRNRSGSFDKIDLSFFQKNWPKQSVKMTIDPRHPLTLAEDIIFIHNLGFPINGADFAEGFPVDWESMKNDIVIEMDKLLDYYLTVDIAPAPIIDMRVEECATSNKIEYKKWCGAGTNMVAYDTDGRSYPCTYFTPLTFPAENFNEIQSIDFHNINLIDDAECRDCYIKSMCLTCYGANYELNHNPGVRDKSKCKFVKLRALYSSKLLVERFLRRENYYIERYPERSLMLIEATMRINELYKDILT